MTCTGAAKCSPPVSRCFHGFGLVQAHSLSEEYRTALFRVVAHRQHIVGTDAGGDIGKAGDDPDGGGLDSDGGWALARIAAPH